MNAQSKVVPLNSHPDHGGINRRVKAQKLLGSFKNQSIEYARTLMQQMFDSADDRLFKMAEKADNNTDQSVYFDSMRIVRLKRKEIESDYRKNIDDLFSNFWTSKPVSHEENTANSDLSCENLSLMEEVDLEESLAISTLSRKIRVNYAQDLHAIEQRLQQIAPNIEINTETNPLDPENLCTAFRDATETLDTEIKIKLIVYKLFDQHINETIGKLYQAINSTFIDAGIMPKIKTRMPPRPSADNPGAYTGTVNGQASASDDFSTPAESFVANTATEASEVLVSLQQLLAQSGIGHLPTGGMQPAMGGHLDAGGLSGASSYAASSTTGSTEQVLNALNHIQSSATLALPENSTPQQVSSQIKNMLLNQVTEVTGQPTNLNPVDDGIIDVVSMLFEFILDDDNLPAVAKAEIARLQIPMLKVAIIDKEFFSTQGHPARVLLNTLARAGIGLDESTQKENDPLIIQIEHAVEKVLAEFENDINVFATVLQEFNTFMDEQHERDHSAQKSALAIFERKEEVALAQAWVKETLEEVLANKQLPEQIEKIIQGPWREVMLHTWLNQGENSVLWKNQLRFIDVLAWSVEPKKISLDKKKLGNIIKQLIQTLRQGLANIDYPEDKTDKLFNALEAWHLASMRGLLHQNTDSEADEDAAMMSLQQANPDASFFLFADTKSGGTKTDDDLVEPRPEAKQAIETPENSDISTTIASLTEQTGNDEILPIDQTIADMEEQVASLSELENLLNEVIEDSETEHEDREIMEDIVLSSWEEPDAADDYPEDEYLDIARHLDAGKWVEFFDDNGNTQRAKLAWKSDLLGEYTFLNWKFDVVADKTLFGLAADLRCGRAKVIEDIPILDRALTAVLSGIKRSA